LLEPGFKKLIVQYVNAEHAAQFESEGYFILESVISDTLMETLESSCDVLIKLMHDEMDRLGTDHIHISHRGKRYHIAKQFMHAPGLDRYVFSKLMEEICRQTLGDNACLFYDQYVVKAAEQGISFSWHQDSGYLGFPHEPYITCWAAVDDMTVENGTAWILPYSQSEPNGLVEHVRNPVTGDKSGYFGDEKGIPVVVPKGSVAVFSSLTFHRSGPNRTDSMRRAYVTQYSSRPIIDPSTNAPVHLAIPFISDGEVTITQ
jgi:hypothetical protein